MEKKWLKERLTAPGCNAETWFTFERTPVQQNCLKNILTFCIGSRRVLRGSVGESFLTYFAGCTKWRVCSDWTQSTGLFGVRVESRV